MLKFDMTLNRLPFELKRSDGVDVELYVDSLTVADDIYMVEQVKQIREQGESGYFKIPLMRIQRTVKRADNNERYWETIDEVAELPLEIINGIGHAVDQVNPLPDVKESLKEKKSKS